MSTDIKDISDTVEEVAFGAAETVAEVAGDPIGSVRKSVKGLERKGTPATRRINRKVNARFNAVAEPAQDAFKSIRKTATRAAASVADQLVPEKVVLRSLREMKHQAKRSDIVGDAAKTTLKFFNRSFKTVARVATRFENASDLTPASKPASKPATTTRRRATRRSRRRAA